MRVHDWFVARARRARRRPLRPQHRPCLELLEDRSLPSVFTVIDMGDVGIGFEDHGDLRYCITQANANGEPSNQIKFHRGLEGTIVLTQGPLDIAKDLTIRGPADGGITISGNHRSGVFDITADPRVQSVTLADLTIAGGTGITINGRRAGGGLYNDHATVTLSHVVVTGNTVASGGYGGGIENVTGSVILNASTVSGNAVVSDGYGGGIHTGGGVLTLNASTVSGNSVAGGEFGFGGGISSFESALVVLNSSLIADNHVQPTGVSADGGGLSLGGPAAITDSTIRGNTTGGYGGGIYIGERFPSNNRVTLTRSAILGNQATYDGGLISREATITIDHSIVSGNANSQPGEASGLANQSSTGRMTVTDSIISDNTGATPIFNAGQLMLSGSTISGNSTPGDGGGMGGGGTEIVVNCTFSGNRAGGAGGGIFLVEDPFFGTSAYLELTSVTITGNVALGVDTSYIGGGGLRAPSTIHTTTRVVVRNSLIAGNFTASLGPDVYGYVDSLGYNLVGEVEDSRGWASTDSLGHIYAPLDPLLGPLQDNGGPTPTHALLAGSPAIETGDPTLFGSVDQRGTVRLHNGINPPVDVGAFDAGVRYALQLVAPAEVVAGEPFTVTVIPLDAFGFKVTTFTETIHFSSSDSDAVLPADYTFTPEDAGVASFRATLQTPGSQQLVVSDVDIPIRTNTTVTVDPPTAPGTPRTRFADLAFAEADPMDGWLPVPGRKRARLT